MKEIKVKAAKGEPVKKTKAKAAKKETKAMAVKVAEPVSLPTKAMEEIVERERIRTDYEMLDMTRSTFCQSLLLLACTSPRTRRSEAGRDTCNTWYAFGFSVFQRCLPLMGFIFSMRVTCADKRAPLWPLELQ